MLGENDINNSDIRFQAVDLVLQPFPVIKPQLAFPASGCVDIIQDFVFVCGQQVRTSVFPKQFHCQTVGKDNLFPCPIVDNFLNLLF